MCCAERCFSAHFGFDRKITAWKKKIKAIDTFIHGAEKIHAFCLKYDFRILPGKIHVDDGQPETNICWYKSEGKLPFTWVGVGYWLDIVWFLDSSLAEGQREALSRHIFSLLGNGVRRVLLTCLTDAAPRGFHYKPSSLRKGLLY